MANSRFNSSLQDNVVTYLPYFVYAIIIVLSLDKCFFFDTIQLSSLHASWYYDNNFHHFLLPDSIDSGHPPLNGMLLALLWKIFGKSLWVGHAFMSIWIFIFIYQLQKTCEHLFDQPIAKYVALVVLMDATILGQSLLVSPDIILIASFFTAINAIFDSRKIMLTIALLILALISMRGMMCTAALFFFYWFIQYKKKEPFSFKVLVARSLPFLPSTLLAFGFLGYHYYVKGWIGYHKDMPWAESFQKIHSLKAFGRNVVIMAWRFLDFGRFFIWIVLLFGLVKLLKRRTQDKFSFTTFEKSILFLFVVLLVPFCYSFLFHKQLSGHRYLLPLLTLVTIFTFILLEKSYPLKKIKTIAIVLSVLLFSFNFIRYPEKIATGWDSTLSHYPFYELRKQMLGYISQNNISTENIASGFCIAGHQNDVDLLSSNIFIKGESHYTTCDYFIYSNINNLPDDIIDAIKDQTKFVLIKKFEKGNVFIALYKKI